MPPTPRAQKADPDETQPAPDGTDTQPVELTLELVAAKADAAMAQALALAKEAGELLGDLSARVAAIEDRPTADTPDGLAERVARLEQNVTLPREREQIVAPDLCDDCGAPKTGQHFDDCQYLANPEPKGPRNLQAARHEAVV